MLTVGNSELGDVELVNVFSIAGRKTICGRVSLHVNTG